MLCPKCRQENDADSDFCVACGHRLPPPAIERFCSECGEERPSDAAFCPNCGAAFESSIPATPIAGVPPVATRQSPAKPDGREPSGNGLKIAIGLLAVCLVLVLGGFGVWYAILRHSPPSEAPSPARVAKTDDRQDPARERAFQHFTRGMELMEGIEHGKADADTDTLIKALEQAEQATLIDPSVAVYWHLLGHIYAQMREDQMASVMAEDALNKAIRINPDNIASRLLLARLLLARASHSLALDQLEWVVRKDAKKMNALLIADMCRAYVVDEQAARGEKFLREMRGLRPELSALRLGLAILLHEQGKRSEALAALQEVLADQQADADDVAHARTLEKVWRGA